MPLPVGFRARPLVLHDGDGPDIDSAFAIVFADNASVLDRPDETRETVRAALTCPDAVLDEHRLIEDAAGNPVALLGMEREGGSGRVFFDAYAVPELKSTLMPSVIELAIEAAPRIGNGELRSAGHSHDEVLMTALQEAGFTFLRRFWRMEFALDGYPTEDPAAPLGVSKTVAVSENDRRLLHSVHTSAFADHFGSEPETYESWFAWSAGRSDERPDLRWIVWKDGDAVAESTGDDSRAEYNMAYVRTIAVLKSARGMGIARWLLQCHFAQAARDGRNAVMLTVDSENTTGATGLYESVGMRPIQVIDLLARSQELPRD